MAFFVDNNFSLVAARLGILPEELEQLQYDQGEEIDDDGRRIRYYLIFGNDNPEDIMDRIDGLQGNTFHFPPDLFSGDEDPSWYEDFLADYRPEEPFEVFSDAAADLWHVLSSTPSEVKERQAFQRMVFLQFISLMEAYLSDRLIKIVMSDSSKLIALIGAVPELRNQTAKLIELAKDPERPAKVAKGYLQRASFHDVSFVDGVYKAVLNAGIFIDNSHEHFLNHLVELRHHCVHRNGRNHEGADIDYKDIDPVHVSEAVNAVVNKVEKAYAHYDLAKFFGGTSP